MISRPSPFKIIVPEGNPDSFEVEVDVSIMESCLPALCDAAPNGYGLGKLNRRGGIAKATYVKVKP